MSSFGNNRNHGGFGGGRGFRPTNRHQQYYPAGIRCEVVEVPSSACGLIVGTKGRNIKELQKIEGIQAVQVDFGNATVKIVGNENGISAVKQRIEQARCLAASSAGYFPEQAQTCLRLQQYSSIQFVPISTPDSTCTGVVRTEQLDTHRQYFVIQATDTEQGQEDSLEDLLSALALGTPRESITKSGIQVCYSPSKCISFFDDILRKNIASLGKASTCVAIGINFGKTFLSSIPDECQGPSLTMKEVSNIAYGEKGIRPVFIRQFPNAIRAHFERVLLEGDDYVPLSSGNFIVIHCVSQSTKKRYTIKLRQHKKDAPGNSARESLPLEKIRQVATAKDYFEVLDISGSNLTSRAIQIAYQRMAVLLHPDKNCHPMAGNAMIILNEARETLADVSTRQAYQRSPTRPKNSFHVSYKDANTTSQPLPDVETFRSKDRKLGLFTVLSEASRCEFRTTLELQQDESHMDQRTRQKLQEAWDNRDEKGRFRFPSMNGVDDWLLVETIRYKHSEKFTNGSFVLTLDRVTEEYFGKPSDGINITLKSIDVDDTLGQLRSANGDDRDGLVSRMVAYMRDLQEEAEKIAGLLDACRQG